MPKAERHSTWTGLRVGFCMTGTDGETVSCFLSSLVGVHGQLVLVNGDLLEVEVVGFHQGLRGVGAKLALSDGMESTVQHLVVRVVHDGEPVGAEHDIALDVIAEFNIY
jgi:hypothetical protein